MAQVNLDPTPATRKIMPSTKTVRPLLLASLVGTAGAAHAAEINTLLLLNQAEFRGLSEDLGAALSFKPLIPAEPMGVTGFDIGVAVTGTRLQNRATFEKAAGGASVPATLPVPTVRVHKGLPFDIDIGATYGEVPSSNARVWGGELRWAVLPGSTLTPAVALRASISGLTGVDQLKLRTTGLDISVSKGFAMLTPYAGVGVVRVRSEATAPALLSVETFNQTKVFAGLNLNFGLVNLAFEGDRTGDATSYGAKFGFRF
jgi:hypothetical protein